MRENNRVKSNIGNIGAIANMDPRGISKVEAGAE